MSRFDILKQARKPEVEPFPSSESHTVQGQAPHTVTSKRGSPNYRQFSAYLRADLYRKLKIRVAERDMDLSDAINEAVENWIENLGKEDPRTETSESGG